MDEATGVIVDTLGHLCTVINGASGERATCMVKITKSVEVYDNGIFVGIETQAMFDRGEVEPMINDILVDDESEKEYLLVGIRTETDSKLVFFLSEQ